MSALCYFSCTKLFPQNNCLEGNTEGINSGIQSLGKEINGPHRTKLDIRLNLFSFYLYENFYHVLVMHMHHS